MNVIFQFLGILAGIISLAAVVPYVRDIIHHKAQPERASWLIWLALSLIAFTSQLAEGATSSLWLTVFDTIGMLIVFSLSLKFGVGGFTRRDIIALLIAATGLMLWYVTRHAVYALFIAMAIDAIGTSLTVVKTYADPTSETYTMWIMVAVAGVLSMISVGKFDLVLLAYPFYILLANLAVVAAIAAGQRRKELDSLNKPTHN
jgi:hypothetical protein